MKSVAVRAVVALLALAALAAFLIDWEAMIEPGEVRSTIDAQLDGNPTQLKAHVSGYLAGVPAGDYRVVHAGELLFQVDDRDYRARVARSEAEVAAAEAGVDEAKAEIAEQMAQVDAAKADLDRGDALLVQYRQEQSRQAAFLRTESYLARDWQTAMANVGQQQEAVLGQQRALTAQKVHVDVLQAQLASREATLAAQHAALADDQVQLGYTRVLAPFDGVTTERLERVGDYVGAGAAFITVVPLRGAWAVANFREVQLTRMRPGQPARVRVDAIPGAVFRGHVDSIGPISQAAGSALPPNRAAGSFTKIEQRIPVKVALDDRPDFDARLLPGLSAEVDVYTDGDPPARSAASPSGQPSGAAP